MIINKPGPLSHKELRIVAERRPFDFLGNARCYETHPLYDQLLKQAARNSVKETPWETLKYAYLYDGQPWVEEVITQAADKAPDSALQFADRIKDEELRREVLARANELLKLKKSAK